MELFFDLPEALENNFNFPLRFNYKPRKSKPILPSIANDQSNSPEDALKRQAKIGLANRLENFIFKKNLPEEKEKIIKSQINFLLIIWELL